MHILVGHPFLPAIRIWGMQRHAKKNRPPGPSGPSGVFIVRLADSCQAKAAPGAWRLKSSMSKTRESAWAQDQTLAFPCIPYTLHEWMRFWPRKGARGVVEEVFFCFSLGPQGKIPVPWSLWEDRSMTSTSRLAWPNR